MRQLTGLLRTMRPRQWHKNGFVFVALVFDHKLTDQRYFLATTAGFALLCLISSTVYLINDLADIEADRAHPNKRNRPLPSGQLAVPLAIGAAVAIPLVAIPLAYLLRPTFAAIVAGYLLLQIAYSFRLKHMVLIDVMAIATGFLLRVAGGVALVAPVTRFSPWLYIFTTMLALFLGFSKRRQELILLEEDANNHRAILDQYSVTLLDELIMIIVTATIMTYALYTFSAEGLPENHTMMLTIPFLLYGMFRYLYLIHVKGEVAPPDEMLFRDRPLLLTVLSWGAAVVTVLYIVPA
jgi:4-hydroxybenzoate polyprenyltransferase